MASIWKNPKSRYWISSWVGPTGKVIKRSTKIEHSPLDSKLKKSNRILATQIANEFEAISTGRRTESQIRKTMEDLSAQLNSERIQFSKTREYLTDWIKRIQKTRTESTFKRYAKPVRELLESLGSKADSYLGDVTPRDIQKFLDGRITKGVRPSTAILDVKCLNVAFELARKQGLILSNPCQAIDAPRQAKETREPFTATELQAILKEAKDTEWETVILFAATLGMRLGDAVSMRWSNVDLAKRIVTFRPQKTKRSKRDLVLPIPPALEAHLHKLPTSDDPQALLTPELAGLGTNGRQGLSFRFAAIMSAAGVDSGELAAEGKGGRRFNKKSFHSLRHTFVAELNRAGVDSAKRMLLAGHTTEASHATYTHESAETLRAAVEALPKLDY